MNAILPIDQKVKQIQIPTLVYSRVSGYYNPVSAFNKGKKAEFHDRKYINIDDFKNKGISTDLYV